jgi:hypothetical protein
VLQIAVLLSVGTVSALSAATLRVVGQAGSAMRALASALSANSALVLGTGLGLLLLSRSERVGAMLGKLAPSRAPAVAQLFAAARGLPILAPWLWMFGSNSLQLAEFAIVSRESSQSVLVRVALLGGTYVLTGSAAVIVPGQVGARELAFAGLAATLGVSAPTAMAFALVPRSAQLVLAAVGLLRVPALALWRKLLSAK